MEKREFISRRPSDTWDVGERIGKSAKQGDFFVLHGELGAGKTQLVKGIARGLGIQDWQYVVSPSFTIMNIYEGAISLCHVDLYRIEGDEVEALDLDEFIKTGIVVVEWAERATWQEGTIRIDIDVIGDEERRITIRQSI